MWSLVFIPMITAAVLALTRWYQISYPLRPFNRNTIEIILGICCLLLFINFQRTWFNRPSKNPTVFRMNTQTVSYFRRGNVIEYLPHLLAILFTIISSAASAITVWSIFKLPAVPGNEQIRAKRIKGALKIALLNVGNLFWGGLVTSRLFVVYRSDQYYILQTILSFLPLLLSTYNPVLYMLLTDWALDNNSRRQ